MGAKRLLVGLTPLLLLGCSDDGFKTIPPRGDVEGYVCHPVDDVLAEGARVEGPGVDGVVATVTDAAGYFLLEGVKAGAQTLQVQGTDFSLTIAVTVVARERVRAPDPPCLDAGAGIITGRICATEEGIGSGEGYWLSGARVVVVIGSDTYETVTDADGYFTLANVPAGRHTLQVTKGSFSAAEVVDVVAGEVTAIEHVCVAPDTELAVVTGEFDAIETVLGGMGFGVRACVPAAFAKCPASLDPSGTVTLVDGESTAFITAFLDDLFLLESFALIFFNCGLVDQYLYSAPDTAKNNLRAFVDGGGSIYVSDRAYEIVRVIFPGALDFVGNESSWGADRERGWVGVAAPALAGTVLDANLTQALGRASVTLVYDKAQWVPLDVTQPANATRWIAANPEVDDDRDGTPDRTLSQAPALASVPFGDGRITFTTFHTHQQANADMTAILRYIIFEL